MLGDEAARSELIDALGACRCTVRLPKEWFDFFEKSGPVPAEFGDKRRFPRVHLRAHAALHYRQTFPSLPRPDHWYKVYTKDISRCGMAFLHGEQLFPRERMTVLLPDGSSQPLEVVRCRRVGPRCYEIGARFVATVVQSDRAARSDAS